MDPDNMKDAPVDEKEQEGSQQQDQKSQQQGQKSQQQGEDSQQQDDGNQNGGQAKGKSGSQDKQSQANDQGPKAKNPLKTPFTYVALLIGILAVAIVLYAWSLPPFNTPVESTSDAYAEGDIVWISPQVSGDVVEVPVADYMSVAQGDLIVAIDDRTYRQQVLQAEASLATAKQALEDYPINVAKSQASLESAKAQLESSQAQLQNANLAIVRATALEARGFQPHSVADQARATQKQAEASVAQEKAQVNSSEQDLALMIRSKVTLEANVQTADANLTNARINLAHTRIYAPHAGRLGTVDARVGQYVTAGTKLTSITPPEVYILANYKETQMDRMLPGLPATFTVDALDHSEIHGFVARISPATGSEFATVKTDNASGNFTKITQRITVRIEFDRNQVNGDRVKPGMSVETRVDTSARLVAPTNASATNNATPDSANKPR